MDRKNPRTSAAARLIAIGATACVTSVSLATENPAPAATGHTLRIARADDHPVVPADKIIEWDMPQLPLREAIAQFGAKTGVQITLTALDIDAPVGPIRGTFSPAQVFRRMAEDTCMDARIHSNRTYSANPKIIPGLNDVVREYNLPRTYLPEAVNLLADASGDLLIGFLAVSEEDDKMMVGPVVGRMTLLDAIQTLLADAPNYTYRWVDREMMSIESRVGMRPEDDMLSRSTLAQLCRVRIPPTSDRMLVSATRLPSLDYGFEPHVLDRRRIEAIGASSIAELLQYLPQTSFTRSSGYRLTGAQYAEGRGVPAMVLIDNTRTMASANSLSDAAFDLNTIPVSAVERIEFLPDTSSVVYGVDSLGGIVNIVLRKPKDGVSAEGRYGSAGDGAIEQRATGLAATPNGPRRATLIADHLDVSNLLGESRSRFVNQDYRRYGGRDRRSLSSAPGNFRSMDGRSVLGLPPADWGESFDAADLNSDPNLTSLLRYQSIAPARTRSSLVASGTTPLGALHVSGNAIYTEQTTQYTLAPPSVQGVPIASDHPQNPLGVPLLYFGLLSGLPSQQYETSLKLFRGSATIGVNVLGWGWSLSLVNTRESFEAWITNVTDPIQVARALRLGDADTPLDILAPAPGRDRFDLLAPRVTQRSIARASQAHVVGERAFSGLRAGDVRLRVGAEWREEDIDMPDVEGATKRIGSAGFLTVRVPISRNVAINAGARHDQHSDGDSVTSSQYGISWRPTNALSVHADVGERFRPPSLYELHQRPTSVPVPVLDPKTNQTTVATIISGGGTELEPTTARSKTMGVSFTRPQWEASFDYWAISVEDRIDTLPLLATLQSEDHLPGRVTRGLAHSSDSPGTIQTIDLGWQNLGELRASGFDFSARAHFDAGSGKLSPELAITWNTKYSFRDLPAEVSSLVDRAGVASARGTVPDYRVVAALTWENALWRVTGNARHHPRYRDSEAGVARSSHVSSQTLIDLNVARRLGAATLQLGASDLIDSEPDFSSVSAWGYDTSQGDLRGRMVYAECKIDF